MTASSLVAKLTVRRPARLTSRQLTVIAFAYSVMCLLVALAVAIAMMDATADQANAAFRPDPVSISLSQGLIAFGYLMMMAGAYLCLGFWHANLAVQAATKSART